jgi:single-stranded-DNA-specific exonuclease
LNWQFREWPDADLRSLQQELSISPLGAAVLYNRGFRQAADLNPPLELLEIPGLEEAARRIVAALDKNQRIRVHADYDADGLTGTALLVSGLRKLGANVHAFVPHRLKEGYGVLMERVAEHAAACELFITVDCGITNHAEIAALRQLGTDVIVTDHHTPGPVLPQAMLVHPMLSPALEHLPQPTGSGVAFLLLWQLYQLLGKPVPVEYADLAAIGTIADVAPLQGFNRALVQEGLRQLRDSSHIGLKALAAEHCREFTATEVAFRVAPRINAASRLGEAEKGLELLTTENLLEARPLAEYLSQLNARRQRTEEEMLQRVLPTIDPTHPALVVHDQEGHAGVMGIVASRLLERFYKPVYIIAEGKGSVRSTPGISAVGGLQAAAAHLKRFGGHPAAAGFAIKDALIPAFTRAIHAYAAQFPKPVPSVLLDGWLEGDLASLERTLQLLEPMGCGNPEPLFYTQGVPEQVRILSEKHLAFRLSGTKVIKWRDTGENLPRGLTEVAAALSVNEWQGQRTLELRAAVYRPATPAWVQPVSFKDALQYVQHNPAAVYVAPEASDWFTSRGVSVVPPEQAQYWFSLPPFPVKPAGVQVALSSKALSALKQTSLGEQVATAYQLGQSYPLSLALERWWATCG